MTKQGEHPSVADCERTLAQLETKREKLIARNAELPALRKTAAFAAHVEASPGARRTLNQINTEVATYESELAAIDDAVAEAKNRVLIAKAFEDDAADRARAARALETLACFKEAAYQLDQALATLAETGRTLPNLLSQLHGLGIKSPNRDQLDALGFAALLTALGNTVWARRFEHLPPVRRQSFRALADAWVMAVAPRLKAQLREDDDKAA